MNSSPDSKLSSIRSDILTLQLGVIKPDDAAMANARSWAATSRMDNLLAPSILQSMSAGQLFPKKSSKDTEDLGETVENEINARATWHYWDTIGRLLGQNFYHIVVESILPHIILEVCIVSTYS